MEKTGENLFIRHLAHVEEHRGPDEQVVLRTDFHRYLGGKGGGTFYQIEEGYFSEESLFSADVGSRATLVLRNIHTENLDKIVFDVTERYHEGDFEIWCGYTATEDSYAVRIEYKAAKPQDSYILVYASGRPLVF